MRIWNQWLYKKNFLLPALFLRLMTKCNASCCVNTSRNSQNFLTKRNWPNSAPTLVIRRILKKDSSSSPLKKKDLTIWKHHDESTPHLEVRKHPAWESGFVETRRSAQSWMWRSTFIKDVIVLRDRTVSWVRIVKGINKYVFETSEEIPFASVETRGTTGKPVGKAQPRPKPTLTVSLVSISYRERK